MRDGASALREAWRGSYDGPLLNESEVVLGTADDIGDDAFRCSRSRLRVGRPLTIGTVGGSNTAGATSTNKGDAPYLYHSLVSRALNHLHRVPHGPSHHRATNGGIPQTGPLYHELCCSRHLPSAPDLIILDVAVNMAVKALDAEVRALERLMRRLLLHPTRPALMAANTHRWRREGIEAENASVFEEAVERLCRHYSVPFVSLHAALIGAVRTGTRRWHDCMKRDGKHMGVVAHAFLAQLVLHRFASPLPSLPSPSQDACDPPASRLLPSPLHDTNLWPPGFVAGCTTCADAGAVGGVSLAEHVTAADGFAFSDMPPGQGRPGYVAHAAGASLSLRFCCTAALSPSAVLFLTYYRGPDLGRAQLDCSGGCTCDVGVTLTAQTRGRRGYSDTYPMSQRVVLRVANQTVAASGACCTVRLRALPPLVPLQQATSGPLFKLLSVGLGGHASEELNLNSMRTGYLVSQMQQKTLVDRTRSARARARREASGDGALV